MSKALKYIIVEDRRIDELHLLNILSRYPCLKFEKTAQNLFEAISFIEKIEPELVFMDIELPDGSGIELVKLLNKKVPMLVFITSYPEYALDGFELSALDYLTKPFSEERFNLTYQKIIDYSEMTGLAMAQKQYPGYGSISIKEGYKKVFIDLKNILYLEAMQDYTKVVTASRKYMVNTTLSRFLEEQQPDVFIRIHRSYAVAKQCIRELHADKIIGKDFMLPIGKTYRQLISKMEL